MNEHADTDEEVIRLIPRNDALCHAVGDCLGDSMLSWAEHLHRLLSVFEFGPSPHQRFGCDCLPRWLTDAAVANFNLLHQCQLRCTPPEAA